jgi:hypothetical protein
MAVAFRAAGTFVEATGSNPAITYPAGVATDDMLVMQFALNPGGTATTPSGWTKLFGPTNTSGGGNPCYLFYKIAGGSEPSTVTVTVSATQAAGIMAAYTGVDGTTPIDVSATATLSTSGGTTATTPSVTTTVANDMLLRIYWGWGGTSVTPPGSDTERYDSRFVGQDIPMECATSTQVATGASGTTTATFAAAYFGGLGATIALAPGAGGGGGGATFVPQIVIL